MGVSLSYATADPIDDPTRKAIVTDAAVVNSSREWWCENLVFFPVPEDPERLFGNTKVFLPGYTVPDGGYWEVDPDDDTFMAWYDMCFIVECLTDWARRFNVTWSLSMEGEPFGIVSADGPTAEVQEFLAMFASDCPHPTADPSVADGLVRELRRKYASRNDPA